MREREWENKREEIEILFENPQIEIFVDWWSTASSTLFSKLNLKERWKREREREEIIFFWFNGFNIYAIYSIYTNTNL